MQCPQAFRYCILPDAVNSLHASFLPTCWSAAAHALSALGIPLTGDLTRHLCFFRNRMAGLLKHLPQPGWKGNFTQCVRLGNRRPSMNLGEIYFVF